MTNKHTFLKTLGLWDATAIVAGSMIGSGIFLVSSDIARQVDSAYLLLVVWFVAGLMTVSGALCYGEYAASLPHAGGQYVYLKKVWGNITGFLYGWTLFLVIQTGTLAAVAVAFAKFFKPFCPYISSDIIVLEFLNISISTQQLFAISLLVLLTIINSKGIKMGAIIQNVFTSTKIIALIGLILCGLFLGLNLESIQTNFAQGFEIPKIDISPLSLIAVALVGALFSSDAWNNVTFIASEVKDTAKNLPRALILGTGTVILLYFLTNLIFLLVLPISGIQNAIEDNVGNAVMSSILGGGEILISIIILISIFGCANGMTLAGARVYYAMANDGLFFKRLSEINPTTKTPQNSLALQCLWASILVLSGSYLQLLDYVIFAALLFYILTVGGLFRFRSKYPDLERPYKTLFYPFLPIFYCVLAIFVAINLLIFKPVYTWAGLLIVLSGIPVYFIWKKIRSKDTV